MNSKPARGMGHSSTLPLERRSPTRQRVSLRQERAGSKTGAPHACEIEGSGKMPRVKRAFVFAAAVLSMFLGSVSSRAQSFAIDWHTVDGGGGTSTGGVFSVSGIIGQPDAGLMNGGSFSLAGGFWGIISAVPTPGAPLLAVLRTPTNAVVVSWPSPSSGFVLQFHGDWDTTNWIPASEAVVDNGTNRFIIVPPATGSRFYRLFKP